MNDALANNINREGRVRRFMRRHPLIVLLCGFCLCGLFCLFVLWLYLRLTTQSSIDEMLRARGFPVSGEELNNWKLPEDDGRAEFKQALDLHENFTDKLGSEEWFRLTMLKTEGFSDNREALANFAADLAPIHAKMKLALGHAAITIPHDHAKTFEAQPNYLMTYRVYMVSTSYEAKHVALNQNDGEAAIRIVNEMLDLNDNIVRRDLIQYLVGIAVNSIAVSPLQYVLGQTGASARSLRSFSRRILASDIFEKDKQRFAGCWVGEVATINTWFKRSSSGELGALGMDNLFYYPLVREVDQRNYIFQTLEYMDNPVSTYAEVYALKNPPAQTKLEILEELAGAFLHPVSSSYTVVSRANMECSRLRIRADMELYAIACELAAERLEGKPWPRDLSDPRWPRDPFTGDPYMLTITDEAVLVSSAYEDKRHSGKVAQYNRSGKMRYSPWEIDGEDDMVVKIKRSLFEGANNNNSDSGEHE